MVITSRNKTLNSAPAVYILKSIKDRILFALQFFVTINVFGF